MIANHGRVVRHTFRLPSGRDVVIRAQFVPGAHGLPARVENIEARSLSEVVDLRPGEIESAREQLLGRALQEEGETDHAEVVERLWNEATMDARLAEQDVRLAQKVRSFAPANLRIARELLAKKTAEVNALARALDLMRNH